VTAGAPLHRRDATIDATQQLRAIRVQLIRVRRIIEDSGLLADDGVHAAAVNSLDTAAELAQNVGTVLTQEARDGHV
jgi:hypothetical protein